MRCSIEIGSSMPSFAATASVSAMISRTTCDTSGCRASSSSVPPVSALIGLKATLPSSFTQIFVRNLRRHRAAQARRDQRVGERLDALGPDRRSVRPGSGDSLRCGG